jgi:hypothetical protein
LLSLSKIDLAQVAKFYDGSFQDQDRKWFNIPELEDFEADNNTITDGGSKKEYGNGGTGAQADGAAYIASNEEAKATIEDGHSTEGGHVPEGEIDVAAEGDVSKAHEAKSGGCRLSHGMAKLKAAMAVPTRINGRWSMLEPIKPPRTKLPLSMR